MAECEKVAESEARSRQTLAVAEPDRLTRWSAQAERWPAWWHWTIAALLIAIVATLDVTWPSLSVFYLLPTLYIAWVMRGRSEWMFYGALAVMVFLSPFLSVPIRASAKGILNRSFGVSMGLVMVYLIRERRRVADRLRLSNEQLEIRVAERSAELETTIRRLEQSEQRLRQHLVELTILNRVGVLCSESRTEDELLHRTTTLITEALFPDNCGFLLLDAERGALVTHTSFVLSDPTVSRADKPLGTGITGQVALTGQARRVGDVSQEPGYLAADSSTRSELCLPMKIGSKVVGVLNIESRKPNAFSALDEQLASTVVDLVGNALERLRAEQALRWNEERLQQLFDNSPDAIFVEDFSGRVLDVNPAACQLHRMDRAELIGKNMRELVPPDRREAAAAIFQSATTEVVTEFVGFSWTKFQTSVPVELRISRINYFGQPALLLHVRDITTRMRAEAALRESQQLVSSIAQAFPNWIYVFDFDVMGITYSNRSILDDLGYPSEVHGTERSLENIAAYMPPEERPHLARLVDEWQALSEGQLRDDEYNLRHADGSTRSFAGREIVFTRRSDGSVRQVLGTLADITTRKRAEAALQESELQFALFMQHLPGLAWIKDDQGRYVYANAAAEQAIGISLSQLSGKTDDDIFPPETAAQFKAADRQALASGTEVRTIESLEQDDGVLHHSIVSKFSLAIPGRASFLVGGMAIDITDRIQAEAALRESESRLRTILDSEPECVKLLAADGTLLEMNRAGLSMIEADSAQQVLGESVYPLVAPEYREAFRSLNEVTFQGESGVLEFLLVGLKGSRRWLETHASPLRDANGTIYAQLSVTRDVSVRKQAEEALRESEARYRLIADLASSFSYQATLTADHQVSFQWVSGKFQEVTGYRPEELSGAGWFTLIPPEDLPRILEQVTGLSLPDGDLSEALELRIHARSGELRWLRSVVHVVSSQPGEPITIYGAVLDITERKVTEEALRASEERFRELAENIQEVFWVSTADHAKTLYVSPAFEKIWGHSCLSIYDQPSLWIDVILPEDRARVFQAVEDQQVSGEYDLEYRIARPDGSRRWIHDRCFSVRDREGTIVRVVGVATDITDRKRAEESLQMMRFSVDRAGDSVFWVNRTGRILYVNDAACAGRGYSRDELLSMTVFDLDPDFQPAVWEPHFEDLKNHGTLTFETRHRAKDGRIFPIEVNANYVHIGDQEFNFASVRDVTERKRQETLLRGQNQVLEMIAANLPLAETLTVLLRHIEAQSSEMLCSILLLDAEGQHLRHGAAPSLPLEYTRAIDGVGIGPCVGSCGTAAFRREAVIVEDIEHDPLWADYRHVALPHRLRACWSTPIFDAQDCVLGTFAIYYRQPCRPTEQHRQLVEIATQSAAVAIGLKREQDALHESEERFRLLFEGATDAIFWADARTGLLTHCNVAAEDLLGRERSEIIGQPQAFLHPPEEADRYREIFRVHATTKSKVPVEVEVIRKDGRRVDVSISPSVTLIGERPIIQGIFRNITERKRTEAALRASEEQNRNILETLPVGVLIHDGHQISFANQKAIQILGVQRPEDLAQLDPLSIVAPEYREVARERVETMLRTGEVLPPVEAVVLRLDGSRVDVEVNSRPIHFAGHDCMQVLFHDITDRKHAEETIQRILDGIAPTTGQEFFSTLVKYLTDVCGVEFAFAGAIDPDVPHEVQTIACSHRGQPTENFRYDTRGTPCEHVVGKTLCFYPTQVQEKFPQDHMLVEMGIDSYLGIPLWSSSGEALGLIALLNDRPFPDPEQMQVILQVVAARCGAELERHRAENKLREHEERMQAELSLRHRDLLHASRLNAIGQMVAGLSHEVAQPLNAITNFAVASTQLLKSDTSGPSDTLKEYIRAITDQSRRCAAILQRLRDFIRRAPTLKVLCDMNPLLQESVELIASETRRRDARVHLELADDLPQIAADRVQIQQVVFNLLNNALDAVRDQNLDRRQMTVRSRVKTNFVVFEVEDRGPGIAPEIAHQLFEPFVTTKQDGMGIGLSICKAIVSDHGGTIGASANEFDGTTFRVRLPCARDVNDSN